MHNVDNHKGTTMVCDTGRLHGLLQAPWTRVCSPLLCILLLSDTKNSVLTQEAAGDAVGSDRSTTLSLNHPCPKLSTDKYLDSNRAGSACLGKRGDKSSHTLNRLTDTSLLDSRNVLPGRVSSHF